ncbi:hypothetical protein ABBQ32_003183 [Trebouxia sp. C0010 RCD-2024]
MTYTSRKTKHGAAQSRQGRAEQNSLSRKHGRSAKSFLRSYPASVWPPYYPLYWPLCSQQHISQTQPPYQLHWSFIGAAPASGILAADKQQQQQQQEQSRPPHPFPPVSAGPSMTSAT